jgi:hypothetical protein
MALLRRTTLKLWRDTGSPWDELLMNLAKLALFGESCFNALATLLLHRPCRLALLDILGHLAHRCCAREADSSVSLHTVGG